MTAISATDVKALREETGSPMMECKKALEEAGGDLGRAREILRIKGNKVADRKAGRETTQGTIGIYQHHDGKRAAMVLLACETDFVARNQKFQELARCLAKQVVAMSPEYVDRSQVPEESLRKEEELVRAESAGELQKKPAAAHAKIIEGRMKKFFEQRCLIDQTYVLDDSQTIEQMIRDAVSALGENIVIKKFARFEIGS